MKKNSYFIYNSLALNLLVSFWLCVSPLSAQDATSPTKLPDGAKVLSFTVETALEPISGVGIVMKPSGVIQKPTVEFTKIDKGLWRATFVVLSSEIDDHSFASVMLMSSEGDIATSAVQAVSRLIAPEIPKCPPQQAISLAAETQVGVLQSLVSIRSARRDNAQARIVALMQGDYLEKLRNLEKGFGLSRGRELSSDLPPLELIDRLSRILNSVHNYKASKSTAE